jgi:two-component system chemotaxis response regulator CheY
MVATSLNGTEFRIVAEASDGENALHTYETAKPDILLLDVIMPGKNGPEVLQAIIHANPAAKVIMLSSMGTQDTVTQCLGLGARTFIQKPFNQESLLSNLRSVAAL